nr:hypothetical protein [uncultured Cohaesibacter sp.]
MALSINSKNDLFKMSWQVARMAAEKFGGNARQYFAECLKEGWKLFKKSEESKTPELTVFDKLNTLAIIVMGWPRKYRGFAYSFILDNAERASRFGSKTKFSEKQLAIIDDMYVKYAH